jgi:predicted RNA binding protein YcfA (HicA-like mRNA interferase family)
MRLPRDVDGPRLVKALSVLGYEATRQKGSHSGSGNQEPSYGLGVAGDYG